MMHQNLKSCIEKDFQLLLRRLLFKSFSSFVTILLFLAINVSRLLRFFRWELMLAIESRCVDP